MAGKYNRQQVVARLRSECDAGRAMDIGDIANAVDFPGPLKQDTDRSPEHFRPCLCRPGRNLPGGASLSRHLIFRSAARGDEATYQCANGIVIGAVGAGVYYCFKFVGQKCRSAPAEVDRRG